MRTEPPPHTLSFFLQVSDFTQYFLRLADTDIELNLDKRWKKLHRLGISAICQVRLRFPGVKLHFQWLLVSGPQNYLKYWPKTPEHSPKGRDLHTVIYCVCCLSRGFPQAIHLAQPLQAQKDDLYSSTPIFDLRIHSSVTLKRDVSHAAEPSTSLHSLPFSSFFRLPADSLGCYSRYPNDVVQALRVEVVTQLSLLHAAPLQHRSA